MSIYSRCMYKKTEAMYRWKCGGKFCSMLIYIMRLGRSSAFPLRTAHHSNFSLYIFSITALRLRVYGLKRAPKSNSVRYSALYVISVSIVTIMAYTERQRALFTRAYWQSEIQSRRKHDACKQTAHPSKNIPLSFIRDCFASHFQLGTIYTHTHTYIR